MTTIQAAYIRKLAKKEARNINEQRKSVSDMHTQTVIVWPSLYWLLRVLYVSTSGYSRYILVHDLTDEYCETLPESWGRSYS